MLKVKNSPCSVILWTKCSLLRLKINLATELAQLKTVELIKRKDPAAVVAAVAAVVAVVQLI